jgi:hypothetical protein
MLDAYLYDCLYSILLLVMLISWLMLQRSLLWRRFDSKAVASVTLRQERKVQGQSEAVADCRSGSEDFLREGLKDPTFLHDNSFPQDFALSSIPIDSRCAALLSRSQSYRQPCSVCLPQALSPVSKLGDLASWEKSMSILTQCKPLLALPFSNP